MHEIEEVSFISELSTGIRPTFPARSFIIIISIGPWSSVVTYLTSTPESSTIR